MAAKECPMCGEAMRVTEREVHERLPGTTQTKSMKFREWVCPECDYFEEMEEKVG